MTDAQMLEALRLRDEGLSFRMIGDRIGVSRGTIAGVISRITKELEESEK